MKVGKGLTDLADDEPGFFGKVSGWILDRIDLGALIAGLADAIQAAGVPVPDVVEGDSPRDYFLRFLDEVEKPAESLSDAILRGIVANANIPWWLPDRLVVAALDPFVPEVVFRLLRKAAR